MFKNGAPHAIHLEPTKRRLLIGYDLMPLRGLRQTELWLKERGIEAHRAQARIVAEGEPFDALVPAVNGKLSAELLAYSSWKTEPNWYTLVIYYYEPRRERDRGLSESEQRVLAKCFWTHPRHKKRKAHWLAKAQAILEQHGVRFVPIKIEAIERLRT